MYKTIYIRIISRILHIYLKWIKWMWW